MQQEEAIKGNVRMDPAELAVAVKELNPYDDLTINVMHFNRKLKGSE